MLQVNPKVFKFVVCNPCQSSPSSTMLVPLWFIIGSVVFFLGKTSCTCTSNVLVPQMKCLSSFKKVNKGGCVIRIVLNCLTVPAILGRQSGRGNCILGRKSMKLLLGFPEGRSQV